MSLSVKSIIARAAIGLLLAGGSAVRAGVVDIPESADAGLFAGPGANNSLATPGIYVGVDADGNVKRGLIQFNVASALPAGSIITGATLQMTVGIVAGSEGSPVVNDGPVQTMSLYNEAQQWGAPSNVPSAAYFDSYGNGATAQTGDATWNNAATPGTAWNVAPGGNWTSSSVDLADAQVPGTKGYVTTWSSAALTAEVQGWLDDPSANDGLLVKDQDETTLTTFRGFYSEQGAENYGDPTLAPVLEVTYTSPVPEPAALSLLIVGLPVVLRRRRMNSRSGVNELNPAEHPAGSDQLNAARQPPCGGGSLNGEESCASSSHTGGQLVGLAPGGGRRGWIEILRTPVDSGGLPLVCASGSATVESQSEAPRRILGS